MKNIKLLARDILKYLARKLEQVWYRIYYLKRSSQTSVALDARLDIGKKISFKKQPSFYSLVMDNSSRIESNAVINTYHGRVHMKENSRIGIGSIVIGPVEIGMNSGVSQYCFITGENREHSKTPEGLLPATTSVKKAKVTIGNGCWIGAGVTILPGVNIGDGTTIAAGAVVTNNIPPHSLAAGIPARVIRTEQPTLSKEE